MFPEGPPDMQSLFAQAAAMQEQLMAAQDQLASTRVNGSSRGGLVAEPRHWPPSLRAA